MKKKFYHYRTNLELEKNNKECGFTLIETLVGINLSLFLLSIIFFFFLFMSKFSLSFTDKIENKNNVNEVIYKIEDCLNKYDEYELVKINKGLKIYINNADSIIIADSLKIKNYFTDKVSDLEIKINDIDKNKCWFAFGRWQYYPEEIIKNKVSELRINFSINENNYAASFTAPLTSYRQFKDI